MNFKLIAGSILMGILLLSLAASPAIASPAFSPAALGSPEIVITSTLPNSHEILALPENSSNLHMYPYWTFNIYSNQAFKITANNVILESGYGPISLTENMSNYHTLNLTVTIGSTIYSYSDISIIGLPPLVAIESVSVTSQYPGQSQYLAVIAGKSGELTYPDWTINISSSDREKYTIYDNGVSAYSGVIVGQKSFSLNMTGNTTSVIVSLGGNVYNFRDELVAHTPISKYYLPPPPKLVATAIDVALSLVRGIVIVFLGVISGMFLARKYIMVRKDNEPQRRV